MELVAVPSIAPESVLELSVLGRTELVFERSDARRVVLTSGKPLALLTFLHCTPGNSASREQLLDLLWSDADPESARHTLRQTLWYVRRKLEFDPFSTTGDGIRLEHTISSNRNRFLGALDAEDPATAVGYYDGDFFPEFAAPGGAGFEHWADIERSRLRALYLGAVSRVVREHLDKGRAREATVVARRARDLAPLHQAAWRLLLESQLAASDMISVAVEVERLQKWLADEEVEPDAATAQLLKTARAGRTVEAVRSDVEPAALTSELVGRESEFAVLIAAFDAAQRGDARHVHLMGQAGHGKTRLLDGFNARLRSVRARVVVVRATTAERSLPYAFAAQLVSALVTMRGASAVSPDTARTLVALAPATSSYLNASPDRSTGDDALRRRSLAVSELVATVSHDSPLVLLVDDVHWMDQQSRTVLASVATRLGQSPVLLVTAARSTDRFVEETPAAKRIPLAPLSVEDVGAMVMSMGTLPHGDWDDALIAGLHSASGGSPLLVLEALQLVVERNQLQLVHGEWIAVDVAGLAETLSAGGAMHQRLSSLPAGARDALVRLSVAGTAVNDVMMTHILSQDGRESMALLETRGLVVHADEQWRTSHDEIAAMAIDLAGTSDRVRAHAAIAEYLERDGLGATATLLRAAQHRAGAADEAALDRVFARAVRSAHLNGERTAIRQLAQEVFGANGSSDDVESLVKRLPWSIKNRPRQWASVTALVASVGVLAVSIALQLPGAHPPKDVTFTMLGREGGFLQLYSVSLDVADLRQSGPIEIGERKTKASAAFAGLAAINNRLVNGDYVGQIVEYGAHDGVDIVRITPEGRITPLIAGPKDQASPILSPDGSMLAYTNGAWNTSERTEVALVNLKTGDSARLTNTDARETSIKWSPDGSRIAFIRSHTEGRPTDVCWVNIDGSNEACVATESNTIAQSITGWRSDYSLLISTLRKIDQRRVLAQLDFVSGQLQPIDSAGIEYQSDESGRLVVCLCLIPGTAAPTYAVFSPVAPGQKRILQLNGIDLHKEDASLQFWDRSNTYLSTVAVKSGQDAAVALQGQFGIYDVIGTDIAGKERSVPNVRWYSSDTSVATIDTTGKAHFLTEGPVQFTVSAGGWRTGALAVTVVAAHYRQSFFENWRTPLDSLWIPFGDPTPTIRAQNDSLSMLVNGDGHLSSGLISKLTLNEQQGAGLRAKLKLPVTTSQWQSLSVALDYLASDDSLTRWEKRVEGLFPSSWDAENSGRRCAIGAPYSEGGEYLDVINFFAATSSIRPQLPAPNITDGRWHTVTIQTFPDGRCGFAIDGKPIAISQVSMRRGKPLRIMVGGHSLGTTIETGVIEGWTGVRTDIDWSLVRRPSITP